MTRLGAVVANCLLVAFAFIALAMLVACDSSDKPDARTPTVGTIVPTAVPTPPYPHIRVRVIEDVDADGRADRGERGVARAVMTIGCYDALFPAKTDADGYAYLPFRDDGGRGVCLYLDRELGWLPTNAASAHFDDYPERGVVEFLVHDLGDDVTEVHGQAILDGLPVADLDVAKAAPPFDGLGEGCTANLIDNFASRDTIVIVVGSKARTGCPSVGDSFDIVANGEVVASDLVFAPGDIIWHDFVVGDDSMRFYAGGHVERAEVLDAQGNVLGRDCAVLVGGGVYVLPDSVRAGCGARGRIVRFFSDTQTPEPPYYWQAGRVKIQAPYPVSTLVPAPARFAP